MHHGPGGQRSAVLGGEPQIERGEAATAVERVRRRCWPGEPVVAHQVRGDQDQFGHGQRGTVAGARAAAERQVAPVAARDLFGVVAELPLRIEPVGVRVVSVVVMQQAGRDEDSHARVHGVVG
jgi:hypothetical protein